LRASEQCQVLGQPHDKRMLWCVYCAGRAGLSLRVVVEAFIPQAGMRSFKKSRNRWEYDDLPLLRSLHARDPNDTRLAISDDQLVVHTV
jgi:hypothetical protein